MQTEKKKNKKKKQKKKTDFFYYFALSHFRKSVSVFILQIMQLFTSLSIRIASVCRKAYCIIYDIHVHCNANVC